MRGMQDFKAEGTDGFQNRDHNRGKGDYENRGDRDYKREGKGYIKEREEGL